MKPIALIKIRSKEKNHIPIFIEEGVFEKIPELLNVYMPANKYAIITDLNTKKLYGQKFLKLLNKAGIKAEMIALASGEKSKNMLTCQKIYDELLQKSFDKNSAILALGGGVVGDIAGFVASIYLRGINFAQIPTTLLAMVDSSIGGKVGIDTKYGKNLIGSVWQPKAIFTDLNFLKTLPAKEKINGLMEIAKIFTTNDKKSFKLIEKNLENITEYNEPLFKKIITKSALIKIKIIETDERESAMRKVLNFGHTIGHAVEQITDYKISHGYAVGFGVIMESLMSHNANILPKKDLQKIMIIFKKILIKEPKIIKADFALLKKIKIEKIIAQTAFDKKNINGKTQYVLLKKIGKIYKKDNQITHTVPTNIIKKSYKQLVTTSI